MDVLQIICYVTAIVVPAFTFRSWYRYSKNQAPGVAGRRPDPTIAGLLCSLAGFVNGCVHKDIEAVLVSTYGYAVHMYCLAIFFKLCTAEELQSAKKRIQLASCYLVLVIATFELSEPFRWLCTATGWLAALAPLVTFVLSGELAVDALPHWAVSLISILHSMVWCARPLINHDNLGASQYAVGAGSSVLLLTLVLQ